MRFRRALDRGNATEALSAAGALQFVGLAEALELTLLLAEGEDARYERAALRWHARFIYETKNVDIRESVAVLALLTAIPANRLAAKRARPRPRPQPDSTKAPSGWTSPDSKRCRTGRPRGSSRAPGMASRRFRRRRSLHVQSRW
jgi:hypothetical protein